MSAFSRAQYSRNNSVVAAKLSPSNSITPDAGRRSPAVMTPSPPSDSGDLRGVGDPRDPRGVGNSRNLRCIREPQGVRNLEDPRGVGDPGILEVSRTSKTPEAWGTSKTLGVSVTHGTCGASGTPGSPAPTRTASTLAAVLRPRGFSPLSSAGLRRSSASTTSPSLPLRRHSLPPVLDSLPATRLSCLRPTNREDKVGRGN